MRNFGDDFDDVNAHDPMGGLDLETGSSVGAVSGDASAYGGSGGVSLDDDLFGDGEGAGGALELDVPTGHKAAVSHAPPQHTSLNAPPPPPALSGVPDLAFDAVPRSGTSGAPPARPSGSMQAVRPSGSMQAVRPSGSMQAVRPSGSMQAVRPSGSMPAVHPSGSYGAVSVSNMPAGPSSVHPASAPPNSAPPQGIAQGFAPAPASVPSMSGPPPAGMPAAPQVAMGSMGSVGSMASIAPAAAPAVKPDAAAIIARFPDPPEKPWQTPAYAAKVLLRQFELRQDLVALRRRRSPDVPLYEAALGAYEPKTFRLGLTLGGAAFVVGTFLFFLPVILRFVRD